MAEDDRAASPLGEQIQEEPPCQIQQEGDPGGIHTAVQHRRQADQKGAHAVNAHDEKDNEDSRHEDADRDANEEQLDEPMAVNEQETTQRELAPDDFPKIWQQTTLTNTQIYTKQTNPTHARENIHMRTNKHSNT